MQVELNQTEHEIRPFRKQLRKILSYQPFLGQWFYLESHIHRGYNTFQKV